MSQQETELVEAYCTRCEKTIEISELPKGESGIMEAQFLLCPDCDKWHDFAYFGISTRPYTGPLKPGYRSLKKETYGQWIEKEKKN